MEEIERMLDAAMTGSFSETNFDESQLSALETKFAHYLSAAEASSRNVAQEKDRIKSLIADISHQTKTPIANLLLYSELLMEETLPASAKANVEALYKQLEKLRFSDRFSRKAFQTGKWDHFTRPSASSAAAAA